MMGHLNKMAQLVGAKSDKPCYKNFHERRFHDKLKSLRDKILEYYALPVVVEEIKNSTQN